jgi:hypothetical protein
VEILFVNTSTKTSSNQAPFDKLSKNGDGGYSEISSDLYAATVIFHFLSTIPSTPATITSNLNGSSP